MADFLDSLPPRFIIMCPIGSRLDVAVRVTYGREKKAYDYLVGKHVEAYYPTIKTVKKVDGKRKTVVESRLPNILFAYGTEEDIKTFV